MCRSTTCRVCGKTTWAGCGQHVQEVRRTVPASQWCNGTHSQSEIDQAQSARPGFLARLFGR
ncbi:hypothetical protein [Agrococcus sp. HG114]|uniref:hypothetical protein n=1 Tax=Agrococcus sp. HG114 TaxID=2969757 RepID=UPI00215AA3ED|nr:hypothetical protein [Agrococcus sp. HG114]MCR8670006.1 hypothetical protein [Agrococcus sp. HG114]